MFQNTDAQVSNETSFAGGGQGSFLKMNQNKLRYILRSWIVCLFTWAIISEYSLRSRYNVRISDKFKCGPVLWWFKQIIFTHSHSWIMPNFSFLQSVKVRKFLIYFKIFINFRNSLVLIVRIHEFKIHL